MPGLVAVVPIFNEAETVGRIVRRLRRVCPVVVVDDGSTDGGGGRAAAGGASRVIRCAERQGKGAALRLGFAEALRLEAEVVATLDGDGQHDPADLPRLLAAARRAPLAMVVGDRLTRGDGDRMPPVRRLAMRIADGLLHWLTGTVVRDTQCGFRVYPAALLRTLALQEEGFVTETEVLLKAARAGHRLVSVPVRRIYPAGRRSRFRALADGVRIGRYLAREAGRETARRLIGERLARRLRLASGSGWM